jgi:hypothetical protein
LGGADTGLTEPTAPIAPPLFIGAEIWILSTGARTNHDYDLIRGGFFGAPKSRSQKGRQSFVAKGHVINDKSEKRRRCNY